MIHNSENVRRFARLAVVASLLVATEGAWADAATHCDVHAAAMVAEMKASATTPMSEQDVTLVRETARKSCLAQNGGAAPAPPVAATPAAKAALPVAPSKSDNTFLGTLGAIFSGPTERKPGNQRLLDRTQH